MERRKYTLNSIKHESKMAEWRIRIGECRNSGQTIKEWCREKHICLKTYYKWQRIIWDAESENRSIEPVDYSGPFRATCPDFESRHSGK